MNIVYIPVDLDAINQQRPVEMNPEDSFSYDEKKQELMRRAGVIEKKYYQNLMTADSIFQNEKKRLETEYLTALHAATEKHKQQLAAYAKEAQTALDTIEREARVAAIPI